MKRMLAALLCGVAGLLAALSARSEIVNVSGQGTAQSNRPLYSNWNPVRLIDGATNTAGLVHADVAPEAPLIYSIDLGKAYPITGVKIYPRQDGCCADRLSWFRVSVHTDDGAGAAGTEVWGTDLFTDGSNPGSTAGSVVDVALPSLKTGRHVQIRSLADPVPDYALQIAEVQIFADVPASEVNRAVGTVAAANKPLFGNASAAGLVDGIRSGQVHGVEVIEPPFFYTINLGTKVKLSRIVVWARQDGAVPERLTNYRVSVHDDNGGAIGAAVWQATLHGDGSNPGVEVGAKDVVTADLNAAGKFEGQWIKIETLENPIQSYALQITEVEAFGEAIGGVAVLVSQQPQGTAGGVGRTAQFSVTATVVNGDAAKLTYQWLRNGTPIPDATTATYKTPPILIEDDKAEYSCRLSYPGLADVTTEKGVLRVNLAYQAAAAINRPLWANGGWNISMITDGDRTAALHGDTAIEMGMAVEVNLGAAVKFEEIDIFPRQDGCCPERLANFRVSVLQDNAGVAGAEVWKADLFTEEGQTAGSGPGTVVKIQADKDPAGKFEGQWIRILALADPIPDYFMQMAELEVYGAFASGAPKLEILTQPVDAPGSPGRTAKLSLATRVLNGNPANIGYQWFRDGAAIAGSNTNVYTTPPLVDQDTNAVFHCVVSYPGVASIQSGNAKVYFDYNYSRGQPAFSNRPLWGPGNWSIAMLVDGNRNNVFHADTTPSAGFAYDIDLGLEVAIEHIDIWPRQDSCCADRLANFRVSVHDSANGVMGAQKWFGDFFTDGSNAGNGAGTVVAIDASQGTGTFKGSWVRILALDDPVPDYHLQMTEMEVFGKATSVPKPTLSYARSANGLVLSWSGAGLVLQSAPAAAGPWTPMAGAASPTTVPFEGDRRFFQLRSQ